MTYTQSFSKFWRLNLLQKAALAGLPIAAAIAHATQSPGLLLAASTAIPIGILLGNALTNTPSQSVRRVNKRGATALVRHLNDHVELADSEKQVACVLFELEQQTLIERDWGASTLEMVQGEIVARLGVMMRRTDNIYLLDRGLFGLVLEDIRTPELNSVISLIERLQAGLSQPIALDGSELHLAAAVGFCLENRAPIHSATSIYDSALLALAEARRSDNGAVRAFSNLTPKAELEPQKMQADVIEALKSGGIIPWFQPQISTDTGQVTGFEALARWSHPQHGMVPPSEFIPLLERAGRMEDLSEAILNHALRALVSWEKAGFEVPSVSVNFATQELRNPGLVERIKWDVDRFELEPKRLTVEILETVISESEDDVITRNIRELGSQGFNIDLDDFGTGHATLANIRRFRVDRIKIDRSFVQRADEDPEQRRMVAAIVGMAERLEIETLAEGVETVGEQSILSQLGCTHLQGFGIARPMPLEDTLPWLADHQSMLNCPPLLSRRSK